MSTRPVAILSCIALLASAGLVACGETSVQPTSELVNAPSVLAAARASSGNKLKAPVLRRTTRLRDDEIACAMVPIAGKSVTLDRAGLTVTFSPRSVSRDTYVCLVARQGDAVAYSFYPHGLHFDTPIQVQQSLKGTTAETDPALAASLFGGYLENDVDEDLDASGVGTIAQAFVTAVRSVPDARKLTAVPSTAQFKTDHFSGYALCGM